MQRDGNSVLRPIQLSPGFRSRIDFPRNTESISLLPIGFAFANSLIIRRSVIRLHSVTFSCLLSRALNFQVMQLVGSLYILYFPYCGLILWEVCGVGNQLHLHDHPKLASLASLLLACSPPINSLLYGLKSQSLRRSVQNYWRKKATKSELQQVMTTITKQLQ